MSSWIAELYDSIRHKTTGSVSLEEIRFLEAVIRSKSPNRILELGVASGFSSTFLTRIAVEANSHSKVTSIDFDARFYADNSKPVGFLAYECLSEEELRHLSIRSGLTSFDVPTIVGNSRFDVVFIDADHEHPWTTLDLIGLLPVCTESATIAFHDLSLYMHSRFRKGIGPKYLFDQLPAAGKQVIEHESKNIFSISANGQSYQHLTECLSHSLQLPWTLSEPMENELQAKIRDFILKYWNEDLAAAFDKSADTFSPVGKDKLCESYAMTDPNQWCEFISSKESNVHLRLHPTTVGENGQPMAVLKRINPRLEKLQVMAKAGNISEHNAGALLRLRFDIDGESNSAQVIRLEPRVPRIVDMPIPESNSPTDLQICVETIPDAEHASHCGVNIEVQRKLAS